MIHVATSSLTSNLLNVCSFRKVSLNIVKFFCNAFELLIILLLQLIHFSSTLFTPFIHIKCIIDSIIKRICFSYNLINFTFLFNFLNGANFGVDSVALEALLTDIIIIFLKFIIVIRDLLKVFLNILELLIQLGINR